MRSDGWCGGEFALAVEMATRAEEPGQSPEGTRDHDDDERDHQRQVGDLHQARVPVVGVLFTISPALIDVPVTTWPAHRGTATMLTGWRTTTGLGGASQLIGGRRR